MGGRGNGRSEGNGRKVMEVMGKKDDGKVQGGMKGIVI